MRLLIPVLFLLAQDAAAAAAIPAGAEAELGRWRQERLARLTKPDGWLSLVGLHFLKEGANTVGTAAGSDVVLAKGPARVGVVYVGADGKVAIEPAPGAGVRVDGQDVRRAEMNWGSTATTTKGTVGSVTFFVIDRGGRKALRVRDSEAPRLRNFRGIEYFAYDPKWRVEARWEPAAVGTTIPVTNILGQVAPQPVAGRAVFERGGRKVELVGLDGGPESVFFVIADATSGRETYGGGRHLSAERPRGSVIVLDFNRAENPPCSFTPFATCPVPPKENRMTLAVVAGEKKPADHE